MANEQKYFLTYDFRIIYNAIATLKELDSHTFAFKTLDVYINLQEKAYEVPQNMVQTVISVLYKEPIGFELAPDKMKWIQKFEEKLQNDSKILRNRSLTFNYLILKLLLCGFPETIAKEFVINYYTSEEVEVTPLEMIQKIDYFLAQKKYWIMNNLKKERGIMRNFIINMLKNKLKDSSRFDFNAYRDEDQELCSRLILPKLIKFNNTKSYLIQNPINLTEQKPYLVTVYEMFLRDIMTTVLNEDIRTHFDTLFIDSIIKELVYDGETYLQRLEMNPNLYKKI